MKIKLLLLSIALLMGFHLSQAQYKFQTKTFGIELNNKGEIIRLENPAAGKNYLPTGAASFLLRIKNGANEMVPEKCSMKGDVLRFSFAGNIQAEVKAVQKDKYLTFELLSVKPLVDVVLWGPVATIIGETVGEFVGVVRNGDYAIGIQALNSKTTGGILENEEGVVYSRGNAAFKQEYGSSLQAFCIDRNKDRKTKIVDQFPDAFVPANTDCQLAGTKIALFGVPEKEALQVIGTIEQGEGLPHPMLNGKWIKDPDSGAGNPYLITTFTEANMDELLEYAKRIGFYSIYHSHPFENWGHFDLIKEQFPNGKEGMKQCVQKAKNAGMRTGVHTLTNFITTNDPFVTPVPHKGLAYFAATKLSRSLGKDESEIYIEDPTNYAMKTSVQTIRIGDELIRFGQVSKDAPYRLLNCQRGAFGTATAEHQAGEPVRRLVDHGYKTLYPNWEMQKEMIQNLVDFMNETGVSHMDFDGHEGTYGTGNGDYAMDYFSETFLAGVDHMVVNGSSRSNHYYWHMNTYLNWGEPWYAGFKESQGSYRFSNQALLERNYMPNMLGWFLFGPKTTLEEMEWMLARSAGYNAGYALVANLESLKTNPQTDEVIRQINVWEEARKRKIFNTKQLEALKNTDIDFTLTKSSETEFQLQYYKKNFVEHENEELQPGQPAFSEWNFNCSSGEQNLYVKLGADGKSGEISDINIELDGFQKIPVPFALKAGESFIFDGTNELLHYDSKGRLKSRVSVELNTVKVGNGSHTIRFDCSASDDSDITIKGYVKLKDKMEVVKSM